MRNPNAKQMYNKAFWLKKLEVLLLETSSHFSNSDNIKIKLDHHKGMHDILALLKGIVDEFSFTSVEKFSWVKVFFFTRRKSYIILSDIIMNSNIVWIYMWTDTKLHLWSVRYQPDGLFDLWRESCLQIYPYFEDKVVFLPQLIKFC